MIVELSAFTNEGRVRTNNEDSWDIIAASWKAQNKTITITGNGVLLAVADGMGGTNAGEVASRIAVETFRKEFEGLQNLGSDENSRLQFLENLIKKAHKNIVAESTRNLDHAGMGTTAVLAWLLDDKAYVAWCGDSRLYVYRIGRPFTPFTDDHSIVWEQVKKGNMNAEQARLSDESNIILQSLGDVKQPPQPESRILTLQQNDRLLLCSDGLNSMLSDGEIESLMAAPNIDTNLLCRQLVDAANIAGGRDNTTVIVANVVKGHKVASSSYPIGKKKGISKLNLALISICLVLVAGIGYYFYDSNSKPIFATLSKEEKDLLNMFNADYHKYALQLDSFISGKIITECNLDSAIQDLTLNKIRLGDLIKKHGLQFSALNHTVTFDSSSIKRDTFATNSFNEVNTKLKQLQSQLNAVIQSYNNCKNLPINEEPTPKTNTIGIKREQEKKQKINDLKTVKNQFEIVKSFRTELLGNEATQATKESTFSLMISEFKNHGVTFDEKDKYRILSCKKVLSKFELEAIKSKLKVAIIN